MNTVAHNLQYALVNFVLLWLVDHSNQSHRDRQRSSRGEPERDQDEEKVEKVIVE